MNTKTVVKSVLGLIMVSAVLITSAASAQVTVPTSGGGGSPATAMTVDLSALTNHAELVGKVFKNVDGILISFSASASAQSYQPSLFIVYTNQVKTLEDIMGAVTNWYVSLPVVSSNGPISISVLFYDSSDENLVRGYTSLPNSTPTPAKLFEGYNGGTPQMNEYGQWVLPDYAEQIQMRLSGNVFVSITNVVSAHLVYTNSAGQFMSMDLPVSYLQGFTFPPDWAGQGILVLGTYRFTPDGIYYDQHAYDLGNSAVEVPITYVLVRALIEGSDDFSSFTDSANMSVQLYVYQDQTGMKFGKVPLLMATYNMAMSVYISVTDQIGDYATSFIIEDQNSGIRTTVNVPTGSQGVNVTMPKGVYHIIPEGMDLQPWWKYTYYYGGEG